MVKLGFTFSLYLICHHDDTCSICFITCHYLTSLVKIITYRTLSMARSQRILAKSKIRVNANPRLWKKKRAKVGPAKRQATLTVFSTILNFHIHPPYSCITYRTSSGIYVIFEIHNSTTTSTNT